MKVAHLTNCLEFGGTERSILNLCLHAPGRHVVVSFRDGPIRPVFEASGIEVRIGPEVPEITEALIDAQVVNIHWCGFISHLMAACVLAAKPTVFTVQWLSEMPRLPGPVICASQHVADLQKHNRDNTTVITNGIETRFFTPGSPPDEPVRIARVCRPAKCDEYFWPVMFQALAACPNTELAIAGGLPFRTDRIRALGTVEDVAPLLQESHLFAYAPRPGEGAFDLCVLEAMSCGLPCVVTDVPCVNESVIDGETGVLVPYGDCDAFAEAVVRLVRDTALRKRMAARAAEVARARYDVRDRADLFGDVYERAYREAQLPAEAQYWRQRLGIGSAPVERAPTPRRLIAWLWAALRRPGGPVPRARSRRPEGAHSAGRGRGPKGDGE